jgi:hypothetical protein
MQLRKWEAETKAMIVIADLKGMTVAKICGERPISQGQCYQWRDHCSRMPPKGLRCMSKASRKPA